MDSLEIKVRSASGLKDLNTIGTMDPYVSVMLSSDPRSKLKTEVHTDGGQNPTWKGKPMRFALNQDMSMMQNVTLVFKIMAEKPFGDKEVGEVLVPVKEFFQGDQLVEKLLSYSVSMPGGKSKGTLNFSYKVVENVNACNTTNVTGGYGPPMAVGPGQAIYGTGPYPPPNPQPQYGAPTPYPPQRQQPYYPPPPPQQQGYPPQQGYGHPACTPPPPEAYAYSQGGASAPLREGQYAYPHGGAPPPPGPYAYPHAPWYPSGHGNQQHQMKHAGKKPKSKAGGLLGLGALGIGAGLVGGMLLSDMASGFGDIAGGAVGDVADSGGGVYDGAETYCSNMNDSMDLMNSIV